MVNLRKRQGKLRTVPLASARIHFCQEVGMQDFEKLGLFYLGKPVDVATGATIW